MMIITIKAGNCSPTPPLNQHLLLTFVPWGGVGGQSPRNPSKIYKGSSVACDVFTVTLQPEYGPCKLVVG